MTTRHAITVACLTVAAAVAAVGCKDDSSPKYGTMTSSSAGGGSMSSPPPTVVPAGAKPLATGTYNQIQFTVPDTSGQLFILDQDTNTVVGSTNSVAANAGKTMTMADLKNTTQGLNMTDHYGIYFAPTMATTRPLGGGSGM